MKLYSINAGYFKLDGGAMHGVVPKSMWNKVNPSDESNMCTWAMRCMLIDLGNNKVLVDTGMGDKQDEKFFSYYHPHGDATLEKSLAEHGFKPEDITDVFLTHLHFDHCGGAIKKDGDKLVPAFPNAIYWSNEKHWEAAVNPNEREKASFLKENILPIKESGQLRMAETNDGGNWIKDIDLRLVNGHTDTMMLPLINYDGTKVLYCADLIPSAAHISMPWVMAYDMRPVDTLKEKHQILNEAAEQKWVLFFEHDPRIECCTLKNENGRIKMDRTFPLSELVKEKEPSNQ